MCLQDVQKFDDGACVQPSKATVTKSLLLSSSAMEASRARMLLLPIVGQKTCRLADPDPLTMRWVALMLSPSTWHRSAGLSVQEM